MKDEEAVEVENSLCPFCGAEVKPTEKLDWVSIKHRRDCFIVMFSGSINPLVNRRSLPAWNTRAETYREQWMRIALQTLGSVTSTANAMRRYARERLSDLYGEAKP